MALLAVGLFGLVGYGLAESYRIQIKQFTIASPDVPAGFDGTRIVLLTDIHRGAFFSQQRVARLVRQVNDLSPDIVVLGGDYVYGNTDYESSCFAELGGLQAPLGVFAVLGNHDYRSDAANGGPPDPTPSRQAIQAAGITLLENQAIWLEKAGARIRMGGVGDYEEDSPDYRPTLAGTGPGDFVLLVSHNPDYAEELPPGTVHLVLSGHTHGGQVTFFGLWAPSLPSQYGQKYRSGLVVNGTTSVIVSNGVGTIFPPIRFFARPQIVEISLRRATLASQHPSNSPPSSLHP